MPKNTAEKNNVVLDRIEKWFGQVTKIQVTLFPSEKSIINSLFQDNNLVSFLSELFSASCLKNEAYTDIS